MLDLNAAVAETLKYGFPGVVIIVLVYVIIKLRQEFRDDKKECEKGWSDKYDALHAKYDEVQEKRIAEGRENLNALNNTTNVLDDVLKALQAQGAK